MPTLFDQATRETILARIDRLTPSSPRQWGQMTPSQMLKHMTVAFSVPTGKVTLPHDALHMVAANGFFRWLMIRVMTQWPKNMKTVAEFIIRDDPDFAPAKAELVSAIGAFVSADTLPGDHPVFGVMEKDLWGEAMYIHMEHHLRQFGV